MRRTLLAAAAMGIIVAGAAAMAPVMSSTTTEVRAEPAQRAPAKDAPSKPAGMALSAREDERDVRRRLRAPRVPTAHKNRASGERAHRAWRKRRASGKAA